MPPRGWDGMQTHMDQFGVPELSEVSKDDNPGHTGIKHVCALQLYHEHAASLPAFLDMV